MGIAVSNIRVGWQDYDGTWNYQPNSAGGVSVCWDFQNTGTKTIKYAAFFFIPYNAVGDPVRCSISGKSEDGVKFTGPLGPNQIFNSCLWENAWYNYSIRSVRISKVHILYMDDSDEIVLGSQITQITRPSSSTGGCYIATAVYGSYDCPQVWTLRRYRDYTLAATWYGRALIHAYYTISPTIVKWFGHTKWFKEMWKGKLDRMVANLQAKGVDSSPYEDRIW